MKLASTLGKTAGIFLLGMVILGVASGIAQSGAADDPQLMPPLTHAGMLLLSLAVMVVYGKARLKRFGWAWPQGSAWGRIAALGFAVGLVVNALFLLLRIEFDLLPGYTLAQIVLFVWIWASLCEEVLCRGLLQTLWEKAMPGGTRRLNAAILLSALFFMLMHVPLLAMGAPAIMMIILLPAAFVLGVLAGYVRRQTESILPAVVVHMLFNISGTAVTVLC